MRREIDSLHDRVRVLTRQMSIWHNSRVEHRVAKLEDCVLKLEQDRVREENEKLKKRLKSTKISDTLLWMDQDRVERDLYHLRVWAYRFYEEMNRAGFVGESPSEAIDVLAIFGETQPPEPRGSPPKALAEYRATRENTGGPTRGAGGSAEGVGEPAGGAGGPAVAPAVCEFTFAGFIKCNPTTFSGAEGAVGMYRWFEKLEMVFSISECAERNKNANRMSWIELRRLMTNEFCPRDEIQRMEQELWGLKVKDYDISAYSNRFHELALLCPTMVEPEYKKIKAYICGLSEDIKGDATLSRPAYINKVVGAHQESIPEEEQSIDWECSWSILCDEGWRTTTRPECGYGTLIDINPVKLDTSYEVALAYGKTVSTNNILRGCTLNLVNHLFEFDLMPIELRTFDVIIGIDWLSEHDAVIVCGEKIVRIPNKNKTLIIEATKAHPD
ncbi:putative reverse transcriptase domain-containing protein [Tanacetum coccineum]